HPRAAPAWAIACPPYGARAHLQPANAPFLRRGTTSVPRRRLTSVKGAVRGLAFNQRNLVFDLEFALLHARDQQRIDDLGLEKRRYGRIEITMLLNEHRKLQTRRLLVDRRGPGRLAQWFAPRKK